MSKDDAEKTDPITTPEPDILLDNFKIWIHGRSSPDQFDFWDGNWLDTTIQYFSEWTKAEFSGPDLHLLDICAWLESTKKIQQGRLMKDEYVSVDHTLWYEFDFTEGERYFEVQAHPSGSYEFIKVCFYADDGFLEDLINQLKAILRKYPVRSPEKTLSTVVHNAIKDL